MQVSKNSRSEGSRVRADGSVGNRGGEIDKSLDGEGVPTIESIPKRQIRTNNIGAALSARLANAIDRARTNGHQTDQKNSRGGKLGVLDSRGRLGLR